MVAPGWFLRWDDRSSPALPRRRRRPPLGEPGVDPERVPVVPGRRPSDRRRTGVVLTFWQIGTSGQLELVGTRGHERFDPRSPATTESSMGTGSRGGRRSRSRPTSNDSTSRSTSCTPGSTAPTRTGATSSDGRRGAVSRVDDEALDPARYRSRDELRYSLRSLWMYCGWVRHIYIVTAGQRPEWLV